MSDLVTSLPQLAEIPDLQLSETSCLRQLELQEHISLLPCYLGRLAEGILTHLNGRVLRYSEQYGGVLLSYSKPCVLQRCGTIFDEQPHIHFDVKFTACIFKPTVGSLLWGTVNKVGGDYIGCLVYDCFNAAVVVETQRQQRITNGWLARVKIGSKIMFRVTKLDIVGGILSLRGEHFDLESTVDISPVMGCGGTPKMKQKSSKKRRKKQEEFDTRDCDSTETHKNRKVSSCLKGRSVAMRTISVDVCKWTPTRNSQGVLNEDKSDVDSPTRNSQGVLSEDKSDVDSGEQISTKHKQKKKRKHKNDGVILPILKKKSKSELSSQDSDLAAEQQRE